MQWAIQPTSLSDRDFFDKDLQVSVVLKVEGITDNVLNQDSMTKHRTKLEKYINAGQCYIRIVQQKPNIAAKYLVRSILITSENTTMSTQWENTTGIKEAMQALFPDAIRIKAMSNATDDASSNKSTTTIGKLLKLITNDLLITNQEEIQKSTNILREIFVDNSENKSQHLVEIDNSLTSILSDFFPGYSIKLVCPPPEINTFLKDATLKVIEDEKETSFDLMGHGLQRSAQMALIKYLSERTTCLSDNTYLLLIDEPELYLHPSAIFKLLSALKKLSEKNFQIVFSTHSPISVQSAIENTLIIRKENNKTTVLPSTKTAVKQCIDEFKSQKELLFEFSNSSSFLFCDKAILVEGKTEKRLLPVAYKAYTNKELEEDKIALIRLDGAGNILKASKILAKLGIQHKIIADFDWLFKNFKQFTGTDLGNKLLPHYEQIKDLFTSWETGTNNFPCISAKKWKEFFDNTPNIFDITEKIHTICLTKGYWIWSKGDIEAHVGALHKTIEQHCDLEVKILCEDYLSAWPDIKCCLLWSSADKTTNI